MKPERGGEQHAEPVWKHERGGGDETTGAGTERRGARVRKTREKLER